LVVSDKHRYVFVELPRTGSSAIRRALIQRYDGRAVLHKHATYEEFLKIASEEQKRYFVFSCIRNPLDDAVSLYFKLKTNHKNKFQPGGTREPIFRTMIRRLQGKAGFDNRTSFPEFFLKSYKLPYDQWSSLSHHRFDYVIRFENLSDDFRATLERLALPRGPSLPLHNRTSGKSRDFLSYYTPATVERAKCVFGPYMKQWGYEFPAGWGDTRVGLWTGLEFKLLRMLRLFYWKQVRPVLHARHKGVTF